MRMGCSFEIIQEINSEPSNPHFYNCKDTVLYYLWVCVSEGEKLEQLDSIKHTGTKTEYFGVSLFRMLIYNPFT